MQKVKDNWREKTVAELQNFDYGDPKEAPTNMVRRCLELCRMPIEHFSVGDLRLMIGQAFALPYLVRVAIDHLRFDLLIEGDFYPGDLLSSVLDVDPRFWLENKTLWLEVSAMIRNRRRELIMCEIETKKFDSAALNNDPTI